MDTVEPPSYIPVIDENINLPRYSPDLSDHDFPVTSGPSRSGSDSGLETVTNSPGSYSGFHEYESDFFKVSLGERLWGLEAPTYGRDGVISGYLILKRDLNFTSGVSITIQSTAITTSRQKDNTVIGETKSILWSQSTTLYSDKKGSSPPPQKLEFSLTIPRQGIVGGENISLPASQSVRARNTTCAFKYTLQIDLTRKGFRRHQSMKIPILYLPKSRPDHPHVSNLPLSSLPGEESASVDDRIKTIQLLLNPSESKSPDRVPEQDLPKAVYFTMPTSRCYSAGSVIPIAISVHTRQIKDPNIYMNQLNDSIYVTLVKQVRVFGGFLGEVAEEKELDSAITLDGLHANNGIYKIKGYLDVGEAGTEWSWRVRGFAEIRYVIKVAFAAYSDDRSKKSIFYHQEQIIAATDPYGTEEWEMGATRGLPIPALGLANFQLVTRCPEALRRIVERERASIERVLPLVSPTSESPAIPPKQVYSPA